MGDGLAQHTRQRVAELIVSKPNHEEWTPWALNNGIETVEIAWVHRYPQCLASYVDGVKNEFIFHPSSPQDNVVSRVHWRLPVGSLRTVLYDEDALMAALTGCSRCCIRRQYHCRSSGFRILAIHYINQRATEYCNHSGRPRCPCGIDVRTTGACGEGHSNQHPEVPTPDGRGGRWCSV